MSHCAVVFGGTRGIGRSIAAHFIQNGMKVAVVSRNASNVDTAISEFNCRSQAIGKICDVTDENAVKKTLSTINSELGLISVLVNAAGINKDGLLAKTSAKDINEILACNLTGTIITCKAALRYMIPQGDGCIINIGSIIGSKGNAGQTIYSASKAGLEGFTKSLAKEVGSRNIRVNLISPGFIETDMTKSILRENSKISQVVPLKRIGTTQDVGHMANFLLHATYITGQDIGLPVTFQVP